MVVAQCVWLAIKCQPATGLVDSYRREQTVRFGWANDGNKQYAKEMARNKTEHLY